MGAAVERRLSFVDSSKDRPINNGDPFGREAVDAERVKRQCPKFRDLNPDEQYQLSEQVGQILRVIWSSKPSTEKPKPLRSAGRIYTNTPKAA